MSNVTVARVARDRSQNAQSGPWLWTALAGLGGLHAFALWNMYRTEHGAHAITVFLLTWAAMNFSILALVRRPVVAGLLSVMAVELLVALSRFKFDVTWMTVNFLDLMILDPDALSFLLARFPDLRVVGAAGAVLAAVVLVLTWRADPLRMRRRVAALGSASCLCGVVGLSIAVPEKPWEPFQGINHVSGFVRSGVVSLSEFALRGIFDADREVADRLKSPTPACVTHKPPHIILVLDESSFDISGAPGIKLPARYADHFRSFDGKARALMVETTGGSTWLAEYSALTGLSARSFGKLKFYVTRIAAGRVTRGLPHALRACGYKTFSFYPAYGAFLSARSFQTGTGMQRFLDAKDMGAGDVEPDSFFYERALRTFAAERGTQPQFMFVYTVANHFPWDVRYRPELTPGWTDPGNGPVADEYIRRQMASANDYRHFVETLKTRYPDDSFLIVRFGDHGPNFGPRVLDPALDEGTIAGRVMAYHPRYYTTYYVIDAVNYKPVNLSSALDTVEIAYLPLIVQEAAGLPLDPSFEEQKAILKRCEGLFYRCKGGDEARRFNRLLIDAGLIRGL